MKLKAIIAAIIISPFYITAVILGLLLTFIFVGLLRILIWVGIIDGLALLFNWTSRLMKRYNLRKLKPD